jgi:hypothetical protein
MVGTMMRIYVPIGDRAKFIDPGSGVVGLDRTRRQQETSQQETSQQETSQQETSEQENSEQETSEQGTSLQVGRLSEGSQLVMVYFEGNRFGADNLQRWVDRVNCAAGRLLSRYPTVATALLPVGELEEVGVFDVDRGVATLHDERARLVVSRWTEEGIKLEELTVRAVQDRELRAAATAAAGGDRRLADQLLRRLRRR